MLGLSEHGGHEENVETHEVVLRSDVVWTPEFLAASSLSREAEEMTRKVYGLSCLFFGMFLFFACFVSACFCFGACLFSRMFLAHVLFP